MADIAAERRSLERPSTLSMDCVRDLEITPRNSATDDDAPWMPPPPVLHSPLAKAAALEVELLDTLVLDSDLAKSSALEIELLETPLKLESPLGKAMAAAVEAETSPQANRFMGLTLAKPPPPPASSELVVGSSRNSSQPASQQH